MTAIASTIHAQTYTLTSAQTEPLTIASVGHAIFVRRVSEATANVVAVIQRHGVTDPLTMPLQWLEGFRFFRYDEIALTWAAQANKTVNTVSVVLTAEIWTWGHPCAAASRAIEMYGSPLVPSIGT